MKGRTPRIRLGRWEPDRAAIATAALLLLGALLVFLLSASSHVAAGPAAARDAVERADRLGPHETNRADCRWTMIGSGGPDWRRDSVVSGPVAVFQRPLRQMFRDGNGMTTKMPILIVGHRTVRVSAPRSMRKRVFLYYGFFRDRNGRRTTAFARAHGHNATEFHPCADKPRTIWPGGIRVKGMKPVRLRIDVEGESRPRFLNLGRPKLYRPPPR